MQLVVIIAVRLRKLSYNSRVKMEGNWEDEHALVCFCCYFYLFYLLLLLLVVSCRKLIYLFLK